MQNGLQLTTATKGLSVVPQQFQIPSSSAIDGPVKEKTKKRKKRKSKVQEPPVQSGSESDAVSEASVVDLSDPREPSKNSNGDKTKTLSALDQLERFEDMADDDYSPWLTAKAKKPAEKKSVLYIGKLEKEISSEQFKEAIAQRASKVGVTVKFEECKVFKKEESSAARIVFNSSSLELLSCRKFWPRPVYCRAWKFEERSTSGARDDSENAK